MSNGKKCTVGCTRDPAMELSEEEAAEPEEYRQLQSQS